MRTHNKARQLIGHGLENIGETNGVVLVDSMERVGQFAHEHALDLLQVLHFFGVVLLLLL